MPEVLLVVGLPLANCVYWWTHPQPAITWKNFEKIRSGVTTENEVIALLGGPPGDYTTGPPVPATNKMLVAIGFDRSAQYVRKWEGDECTIELIFNKKDKKVHFPACTGRHTVKTDWLGRLKYRLSKNFDPRYRHQ